MKDETTIEQVAKEYAIECYPYDDFEGNDWEITLKQCEEHFIDGANQGIRSEQDRVLDFLYSEITERRDYSASKMCEKIIEFIKKA